MIFELNNGLDNKIKNPSGIYKFTTKKNKLDSNCLKFQIGNIHFMNDHYKNNETNNITLKLDLDKKKEIL